MADSPAEEQPHEAQQLAESGDGAATSAPMELLDLDHLEIPPPPVPVMNFDGTGPRLLIKQIVNINFKSYAGKHILGPFHKNFSSIVGPNGSGKSNVIDSLLFVFGYRAQKIRSKKISVLIHNSSENPNIDFCTVEVHFMKIIDIDDEHFETVPKSEFFIGRTAHKDNSSYYTVNNKRTQFKEVGNLLRQNGIDIDHNRFLILQGEVEQISLMKPKAQAEGEEGMLEYLEDIVGSSRLKPIIENLHKNVESLNEIRAEKVQRVRMVEEEKEQLEAPKNEAVAFLKLENRIAAKKSLLYQLYIMEAKEETETVTKEQNAIKTTVAESESALNELKKQSKAEKKVFEDLKKKRVQLENDVEKFKKQYTELEKKDVQLREELKHGKHKSKTLSGNLAAAKKKVEDLKLQPDKCSKNVKELEKKCEQKEQLRGQLEIKLQEGMQQLREETKALQDEKAGYEQELIRRQSAVTDARSKVDLAQGELDLCLSNQTREQKKLDELQKTYTTVDEGLTEASKKCKHARERIPELEKNLRDGEVTLKTMQNEEIDITKQLRSKRSRAEEVRTQLQSTGNRNRVLDFLLGMQRKQKVSGIIGRLGDLGAIDEKYDVAISTACGPLDNIVVDSIDTAQKCIELLKQNKVGMATFIGLDKMKRFEDVMKKPVKTPEDTPRLFDLIHVEDDRVLPAFYYAIRDTLVADSLEHATRIALQGRSRWRVVTLKGDLIDISGTMSGGGNRQSRGRMGRSISALTDDMTPEQLTKLDGELRDRETYLGELRTKKLRLEEDIDKWSRELQNCKMELSRCEMDIKGLTEQKQQLEKQIESQKKALKTAAPEEKELNKLRKNIEKHNEEYKKATAANVDIEANIKRLNESIQGVSDKLVGAVQKQLKACVTELEDAQKSIVKANVTAKTSERNLKKSEQQLESIQQEIQENEAALERIVADLKEIEDEATVSTKAHGQLKNEQKALEEDLQKAKLQVDEMDEKDQQLSAEFIKLKEKLAQTEKTLNSLNQKKNYFEAELKKFSLHDINSLIGFGPDGPKQKRQKTKETSDGEELMEDDGEAQEQGSESEDEPERLEEFTIEYLQQFNSNTVATQVTTLEEHLKRTRPNLDVLNEYRKKMEKHQEFIRALDDVTETRNRYRTKLEELKKQRLNEFLEGFNIISTKLKEMYQMITLGGDADLELVDTMDPFSEGISFSVRPPKKSWKQIANLSGGEKTLSSLSLVFALHHYKPTPLYVMDEIDAALDFKNVSIVANYIKERTKNAQFIIISLRNNMFELADRLVGIYKTHNCTKSVVIDPPACVPKTESHIAG